jgi:hypothetical protein
MSKTIDIHMSFMHSIDDSYEEENYPQATPLDSLTCVAF